MSGPNMVGQGEQTWEVRTFQNRRKALVLCFSWPFALNGYSFCYVFLVCFGGFCFCFWCFGLCELGQCDKCPPVKLSTPVLPGNHLKTKRSSFVWFLGLSLTPVLLAKWLPHGATAMRWFDVERNF